MVWLFDIQGWITLFIGGLLALITFLSSYSHVSIPFGGGATQINQQIGVLLILASLAMLNWRPVVDFELREIEFDRREQQLRIEEQQRQIAH